MHEYPIIKSIIDICEDEAKKHDNVKVQSINIVVGELSGLVPDCLQVYFDMLSAESAISGATLKIEKKSCIVHCKDCGFTGERESPRLACPICNSENITLSGGKDYYIKSMEVE